MLAVVLVGGEGTRLRPLTYTRPKPMLPVCGISILERKLTHLAAHGITEAVLSLGYKPDAFIDAFPGSEVAGVKLRYAVEPSPLDTAGAIRFAALLGGYDRSNEPFVVMNGDVLTEIDLTAQIALHRRVGAEATIALTQVEDPSVFGVVPIDEAGRVVAFIEKPLRHEAPTDWINAGCYILEPSVLGRIPEGERISIERVIFPRIIGDRGLFAMQSAAYWIDAGTPDTYLRANLHVAGDSFVHDTAAVADGALLDQAVVDAGASVGAGAVIRRSVLLPGASVAAGATIEDSVLGSGCKVGAGSHVFDFSVLGDELSVGAGAQLRSARIPSP